MADQGQWMEMDGANTQNGGLFVQFYRGTKYDPIETAAQGFPVSKGVDYVKIGIAGEKDNTIFEIDEKSLTTIGGTSGRVDKRWPEAWRAYKEGRQQSMEGTSLEVLFPASPEVVMNLKANNIYTVQQLANYPDSSEFKFGLTFKLRAQQFLDGLKGNRFHEMEKIASDARNEVAELKAMVAQLSAAQQTEPKRRGPGRPPKAAPSPEPATQE